MNDYTKKLSAPKTVAGIVLAVIVLIIAQGLAILLSTLLAEMGLPSAVCNIIAGALYVAFAFGGTKILADKFLKISVEEMRIKPIRIKATWVITAFLMPALVLLLSVLSGGEWAVSRFDGATTFAVVTGAVFFYGLATGIVEEMVFRGIIMSCLEKRLGRGIAVAVPSVLFGLLHIIGNELDFISIIQLIIAGSVVGILFSAIAYESNSIWNNALVHGIWNIFMGTGILHIGNYADSESIFSFVLKNDSFLISGGDFGIEASVISIFAYLLFTGIAVYRKLKN